jgi:TRAP-type C4-dicarboxylate transport system permease small subunit
VERLLEGAVLGLMAALAAIVVLGVVFRKVGAALVWYDEVAAILLAWLTYYGAALAALRRAHIGVPTVFRALRGRPRLVMFWASEALVIGFFVVVAWSGWRVLAVIGGTSLVSLPWVPARLAQSVVPIGAVLFVLAEALSIPDALSDPGREASGGEGVPRSPGSELT